MTMHGKINMVSLKLIIHFGHVKLALKTRLSGSQDCLIQGNEKKNQRGCGKNGSRMAYLAPITISSLAVLGYLSLFFLFLQGCYFWFSHYLMILQIFCNSFHWVREASGWWPCPNFQVSWFKSPDYSSLAPYLDLGYLTLFSPISLVSLGNSLSWGKRMLNANVFEEVKLTPVSSLLQQSHFCCGCILESTVLNWKKIPNSSLGEQDSHNISAIILFGLVFVSHLVIYSVVLDLATVPWKTMGQCDE